HGMFRRDRQDPLLPCGALRGSVVGGALAMNSELNKDDERFVVRAKQLLDQSLEELDTTITRRLQRARVQALDARPVRNRWVVWISGLAMAAVGALSL